MHVLGLRRGGGGKGGFVVKEESVVLKSSQALALQLSTGSFTNVSVKQACLLDLEWGLDKVEQVTMEGNL